MAKGLNFESASTMREILLRDIPLSDAQRDAKAALQLNKISISKDAAERVRKALTTAPTTQDPVVVRELASFYNAALERPKSLTGILKNPTMVAQKLSVELSPQTRAFLEDVPFGDLIDESVFDTFEDVDLTVVLEDPPLGPDDGIPWPVTPRPQLGGGPIPTIDPFDPHAGIGTATVIIAVAIGVILLSNKDRTIENPIIDHSELKKL